MPLTSAIQSAMAVRMEREKRHQRRLSKIRRESGVGVVGAGHSVICSKRESVASVGTLEEEVVRAPPDKSESMVTTFHLGIVFILLGFIMIFSSMIPSSLIKVRTKNSNNKTEGLLDAIMCPYIKSIILKWK